MGGGGRAEREIIYINKFGRLTVALASAFFLFALIALGAIFVYFIMVVAENQVF
jgi:hypothetical protein